jgi:hypothetical protein
MMICFLPTAQRVLPELCSINSLTAIGPYMAHFFLELLKKINISVSFGPLSQPRITTPTN